MLLFATKHRLHIIILPGPRVVACLLWQVQGSRCSWSIERRAQWSAWEPSRGVCEARAQTWGEAAAEVFFGQKGAPVSGELALHPAEMRSGCVPDIGAHGCRRMQRRHWRARRTHLQLCSRLRACNHYPRGGSRSKTRAPSRCKPRMHACPDKHPHARVTATGQSYRAEDATWW